MTTTAATRTTLIALTLALAAATWLAATSAPTAHAQQGPIDEVTTVYFEECSVVSITVLDSDANFTSVFYRFNTNPGVALGVNSQQVGSTVQIPGQIPAGEELILGIVVNDTGNTFKTGPADRNPDNVVHAVVSDEPAVEGTTVEFEDKAVGEPFADFDYDDARLQLSLAPCDFNLIVQVDPASTGTGSTEGSGTYPDGATAQAKAIPGPGSSFVSWSGDCSGGSPTDDVLMDSDKVCNALFSAVATPTPEPTPEPTETPVPPIAGPPPAIDIANTRTSPSPANVDDTVTFRVDVTLEDVPLLNEAEVLYTFDDAHLEYVGALTSECVLFPIGIVCDFGPATTGFSFDLDFRAVAVTASTETNATLGADYDGAGPGAPETAGPAAADVAIVDVAGVQLPPLGDGSTAAAGSVGGSPLVAALSLLLLGTMFGAGVGVMRRHTSA